MYETRVVITKDEAAERQLRLALRLFFCDGDILAVHTLAAAALGLLLDLGERAGISSRIRNSDVIVNENRVEWIKVLNSVQNFLKHADKDPDATLQYSEDEAVFLLFEAVELAFKVTNRDCVEYGLFRGWFIASHPEVILPEARERVQSMLADKAILKSRSAIGRMLATTGADKGFVCGSAQTLI